DAGADTFTFTSLDAGFTAGLTVTGATAADVINLNIALNLTGNLSLHAATINLHPTGTIQTTGDQSYNGGVDLAVDTVLAGHNIPFSNTVDSAAGNPSALTVNTSGGGTTTFGGAVGATHPLTTLTTNADGMTALNGGSVH